MADTVSKISGVGRTSNDIQRALRANGLYSEICAENGLKVVAWYTFEAWKEYVDGKIDESQLNSKAKVELEELSRTFGKYVVADKDDEQKNLREKKEKLDRARQANRIYRKVCAEAGVQVSFFQDFSSWSDFVEGKISEADFYQRAREEVERVLAENKKEYASVHRPSIA